MNRKLFIENMGLLGASTLLPLTGYSMFERPKFKMGLQLYTVNEYMNKDAIRTLKAAKSMGYQDFETFGFNSEKDIFYGYKTSDFKKILDELQITASSGHFGFSSFLNKSNDELKRFVDQCIKGAQEIDMKYITWPWIAPEQRTMDNFKIMSNKLNLIGEQVTNTGLGFAYHNHGFEFKEYNGETGFDIILRETDPKLVKFQLDMYWIMHSTNTTPKELIKNQPGRYVMWHLKDMDKINKDYTELGNGSIDYKTILPDPIDSGLEFYYIEQGGNYKYNPMRSIADSAKYFKKYLHENL